MDIDSPRNIELKIFLIGEKEMMLEGFLVVSDNGCGMDQADLTTFATYSLDQETRNQRPDDATDTSFISKFGVGAKQAGFFLGNRIRVITKKATSEGKVLELTMDETEFEKKQREGADVYTGIIEKRRVGDQQLTKEDERQHPDMLEYIKSHEENNETFTIVVIRLKYLTLSSLTSKIGDSDKFRYCSLPFELAQIYHFHMHPDNTPDKVINRDKFHRYSSSKKGGGVGPSIQAPVPLNKGQSSQGGMLPDLEISIAVFYNSKFGLIERVVQLSTLQDSVTTFINAAAACFRCNMVVPDPDQSEDIELDSSQRRTQQVGYLF